MWTRRLQGKSFCSWGKMLSRVNRLPTPLRRCFVKPYFPTIILPKDNHLMPKQILELVARGHWYTWMKGIWGILAFCEQKKNVWPNALLGNPCLKGKQTRGSHMLGKLKQYSRVGEMMRKCLQRFYYLMPFTSLGCKFVQHVFCQPPRREHHFCLCAVLK